MATASNMAARILVGDVGATKTRLAIAVCRDGAVALEGAATFDSRAQPSLAALVGRFLDRVDGTCDGACLGVPGPVVAGAARLTNLPWSVSAAALAKATGIASATLVNDLEAMALGMTRLPGSEFRVLNRGAEGADGPAAVIAAGTGLGQAILVPHDGRMRAFGSEGGHCDFAPRSEVEAELRDYLAAKYGGHVSYERILSGAGLCDLYLFFRHRAPATTAAGFAAGDAAAVAEAGLARTEPNAVAALSLFVSIYGAEAGNLALKCLATGGVYIGGGIAPKILPALEGAGFMDAFADKGRMASLLHAIPVRVALDTDAPLLGAAEAALDRLNRTLND